MHGCVLFLPFHRYPELKDVFLWVTPEGLQHRTCSCSCQRARDTDRKREREGERENVPQLNISICSLQCVKYMLIHDGLTELMITKTSSGFRMLLLQRNYFLQGPKKKKRKPSHVNTESQFHSCYCEWREMWKDFCLVYFSVVRCESSDIWQIPPWRSDPTCLTHGGVLQDPVPAALRKGRRQLACLHRSRKTVVFSKQHYSCRRRWSDKCSVLVQLFDQTHFSWSTGCRAEPQTSEDDVFSADFSAHSCHYPLSAWLTGSKCRYLCT